MNKKVLGLLCSACLIIPGAIAFSGCSGGDKPEGKQATIKLFSEDSDLYSSRTANGNYSNNEYDGTYYIDNRKFDGGDAIRYKFLMNESLSYSQNNVSVIEESGKSFDYSVNVTNFSLTRQYVEVVITNYASGSSFVIDLIESTTPIKVSQGLDIGYFIRIYSDYDQQLGYNVLSQLDNIAVYSDIAERFVSMADIKKYEKFRTDYEVFTYDEAVAKYDQLVEEGEEDLSPYIDPRDVQLGLKDVPVTDFKVYVSFGANGYNPYSQKLVNQLVSVRNPNLGEFSDSYIYLEFDPTITTHHGTKCYVYKLDESYLHNLTEDTVIALHYSQDISGLFDVDTEEEIAEKCEFYSTGHRFISNTVEHNVENLKFSFKINKMSVNGGEEKYFSIYQDKNLTDSVKYTITHNDNPLIDFSKFQPQIGNYKATYDADNDVYYLTLPSNVYPSQIGNALYFELKVAPLFTNPSELFNTTAEKVNYKVNVAEVAMFSTLQFDLEKYSGDFILYNTELSADGKTQNVELLTSKSMLNDSKIFNLDLRFLYKIYDEITLDISYGGVTFRNVVINFEELAKIQYNTFYLCYDASKSTYSLHADYSEQSNGGTYLEIYTDGCSEVNLVNARLDSSLNFSTTDSVVINVKEAKSGTANVKFNVGIYDLYEELVANINITNVVLKQNGIEIPKVGDSYIVARGVEFEVELIFDSPEQYFQNISGYSEGSRFKYYNDSDAEIMVHDHYNQVNHDGFINECKLTITATINTVAGYHDTADYVVLDYFVQIFQ